MRRIETLIVPISDADGIARAQQSGIPTSLHLNGVLVNNQSGIAELNNVAQVVQLTSAGNLSLVNFTITGRNADGRIVSETIAGPNIGTVSTSGLFISVIKIESDDAITSDVEAGVSAPASFTTTPVILNARQSGKGFKATQTAELSGGAVLTYTVEFTTSNMQDPSVTPVWQPTDNTNLIGATATATGNIFFPVVAVRLNVTYTSGTINFINIQDG